MSDEPRQGDFLPGVACLYSVDIAGQPAQLDTPLGVVLLSQCCDLVRAGNGEPVAAAVVELTGSDASEATSGRRPRYAHLPWLAPELFVDFARTGAIDHLVAASSSRTPVPTTQDRALLASRIARRFSRFAYPDEVQPFLQRLRAKIREKASSELSPLGQCLRRVVTIRIENEAGWDSSMPWGLSVIFVVNEGELPTPGLDEGGRATGAPTINGVAAEIAKRGPGVAGLGSLWEALAQLLVADAMRAGGSQVVSGATGEVLEESEFSFYRYRRSADIDVDDLSE